MKTPDSSAPRQGTPELFPRQIDPADLRRIKDEHKVGREELITLGSDGQFLIDGMSLTEWDQQWQRLEGPDHPHA